MTSSSGKRIKFQIWKTRVCRETVALDFLPGICLTHWHFCVQLHLFVAPFLKVAATGLIVGLISTNYAVILFFRDFRAFTWLWFIPNACLCWDDCVIYGPVWHKRLYTSCSSMLHGACIHSLCLENLCDLSDHSIAENHRFLRDSEVRCLPSIYPHVSSFSFQALRFPFGKYSNWDVNWYPTQFYWLPIYYEACVAKELCNSLSMISEIAAPNRLQYPYSLYGQATMPCARHGLISLFWSRPRFHFLLLPGP